MPQRKPKKRKPRVKRRVVSPTQVDNIPYAKVRVEWIDILSDSGWVDEKGYRLTFDDRGISKCGKYKIENDILVLNNSK